jgi:hypothetical protein
LNENGKRKTEGNDSSGKERTKKKINKKSLTMGLFHVKKGTPVSNALPDKSKLTAQVCMDFCSHNRKCNKPHQLCQNSKHHTQWMYMPDKDKTVLLKHMDKTGLL